MEPNYCFKHAIIVSRKPCCVNMLLIGEFKMTTQINAFLKLVGAREAVDGLIVLLLGYFLHNSTAHSSPVLGILILLITVFFIHTINDIYDYNIDLANHRNKPLTQGLIPLIFARYLAVYLFLASVLLGVVVPWFIFKQYLYIALTFLMLAIGFCYSYPKFEFSKNPFLAIVSILIGSIIVPYYLGIYARLGSTSITSTDVAVVSGLLLIAFGRVILKDIRDRLGDHAHGRSSLAIILKTKNLLLLSWAALSVGAMLILLALSKISEQNYWYVFLTILFSLYTAAAMFEQSKISEQEQISTIRKVQIKIYMATRLYLVIILMSLYLSQR